MNAPVEKGEDVGSVRVLMDGKLVGETRLLAAEDSLSLKFGQYLRKLLAPLGGIGYAMRLQKFMAEAGVASRRNAKNLSALALLR